jgi:MFS family permease
VRHGHMRERREEPAALPEGSREDLSELGSRALGRRLLPLYAASFLQALALWVPIEKLFMTTIGFTSVTVGVMAAVYSIVVPVLEVPSGILADRWSRRGVLILASIAAICSVVIGGLSQNVGAYMVAAAFLGVFLALQSGTLEAMVYDTVLEETGGSDAFERTIGRVRFVESLALVSGALVGGAIAEFAPLRTTYFLTVPPLAASAVALLMFREPRLHKEEESAPLREQLSVTYRTILARGPIRAVVALTVLGAVLMQGMLEFGPLWLVALVVPAFFYGPHWAGLTAALGLGGLVGARGWITRGWAAAVLASAIVGCCLILVFSELAALVVGAQVLLTLLAVAISIPVMRRLHDAVPSTIRAGVASGVGTVTWLTFVPFALVFGFVSERAGVDSAGWLLVTIGVAAAMLIVVVLPQAPAQLAEAEPTYPSGAETAPVFAADRFVPPDHPDWAGHWIHPPETWAHLQAELEGAEARELVRTAIAELPSPLGQVLVLRDVEGRAAAAVREALDLPLDEQEAMLHRARGLVRTRLEAHLERRESRDRR